MTTRFAAGIAGLSKDATNGFLLGARIKVPVALALLVGLVADPLVNQSLIDALAGTGADETMAQDVEAT